ncbi:MAG: hypothetical protein U9Q77_11755 [Candidatus Marinimicrobia bacterium]|nr:hypothetical protein [Candidatus Neomarinimicrobiota bacterium]
MAEHQHDSADSDRCLKHLMILALFAALLYLVNRWVVIPQVNRSPFFRDHLSDVLALPVYLPLSFYLAVRLDMIPENFQLGVGHILGAVILFSIIFEGLVPLIDNSATRDLWDVPAYLAGGLIVYITCRSSLNRVS